jgi:hypothetical protein
MCYHPEDPDGEWDYDSKPDAEEYFEEDGNLDRFDHDYDEWEDSQR